LVSSQCTKQSYPLNLQLAAQGDDPTVTLVGKRQTQMQTQAQTQANASSGDHNEMKKSTTDQLRKICEPLEGGLAFCLCLRCVSA